ncbi:pseudouridine synthase [Corallococcus macrosporus]|uniref:Ribosomal large subunit pseudouridine synthase A n=1 Tax=Corallococcus macrosporus DSM 14697 TaxID=1189310 RepID=A0A250K253_9BACT|nr:pseudouridine synthase [Corallococcus macrosporus]ATB50145.1 ribosomal large subunit pseudouridine synthase A [Corallococcus macrosporus DSM 14697]
MSAGGGPHLAAGPWFTPFEPQPLADELPERFPSPFDEGAPHALACRAAEWLQRELRAGRLAPGLPASCLDTTAGGKMFGVLAVRAPDGRIGFLRAFSGMLEGRWDLPGFVPPLFIRDAREQLEPSGEALVKRLMAREEAFRQSPERAALLAEDDALVARHAEARAALRATHDARKKQRHARRADIAASAGLSEDARRAAVHALDQESRRDKAELRGLEAEHDEARRTLSPLRARLERRLRAMERLRRIVCRALMKRLHDTYVVPNARGERRHLRDLYASDEPPSGAADCAGPKLLAHALTQGFQPLALAEFWWGAPPPAGGRAAGAYYPACKDKCGPLLPYMLEGLSVAAPRPFMVPTLPPRPLDIVFEDEWLVVVDKPEGLLSVPAKDVSVEDSVLARLRARAPGATGTMLAHRLDLDTSGLLVAAKDARTYAALQRQFAGREVHKRYVAWVEGSVRGERGTIDFPMRVDLDDRPRQIHDPVHGKPAVTEWHVLERSQGRTKVALFPLTGRTHQLRVHAAHPLGLGAPIVGDRLYGHPGSRLHLHAEALSFQHPATGQRLTLERPAPF